jgi:hypothetical protein
MEMEKEKETLANQEETAPVKQPEQTNHTEKIRSQVLAKVGKPPRLDRVEVCRHHNRKYRVNIWQQFELNKNIAVTPSSRIGLSYYLTVSDTGEILHSDPPMTKACFDS